MPNDIFKEGWGVNVLIYGFTYILAQYAVYEIIFRALFGSPGSYHFEDLRHWYRRASFAGAAIFAPLFEEVMFTYLAYASFLGYANAGKEGFVILFVALFFALLHLPGDWRQMRGYPIERMIFLLFMGQIHRFFYSLAAFFIYQWMGLLWVTITIHYFFNAIVYYYNIDLEDHPFSFEKIGGLWLLIMFLNIGFTCIGIYFFYRQFPQLGLYLIPFAALVLLDSIKAYFVMDQQE